MNSQKPGDQPDPRVDERVLLWGARILRKYFVCRADAYALQTADGHYRLCRSPITDELIAGHLSGRCTIGTYQIDKEGKVPWLAFDVDLRDGSLSDPSSLDLCHRQAMAIKRTLAQWDLRGVLELSGRRGIHVLVFLDGPVACADAKAVGDRIANKAGRLDPAVTVEVFPKQASVGPDGFGNCLKLPLGRHRRGGWSQFVDDRLRAVAVNREGQLRYLSAVPLNPASRLRELASAVAADAPAPASGQDAAAASGSDAADSASVGPEPAAAPMSWAEVLRLLRDPYTGSLFRAEGWAVNRYRSRSELEFALAIRLFREGASAQQVSQVLCAAGGKWPSASESYRQVTLRKAMEAARRAATANSARTAGNGGAAGRSSVGRDA